ncbi:MAG: hypothetical protein SVZ03_15005 [Spirochaetota bacterium]|nr:hypothetical protein [Spirochaetota bacterium]
MKNRKIITLLIALMNEIIDGTEAFFVEKIIPRKKILIRIIIFVIILFFLIFLGFIGVTTYVFFKYRPVIWSFLDTDYTYKFDRLVNAQLAAPIRISLPVEQRINIPFKKLLRAKVPFKTVLSIPINKTFELPFEKPISVYLDHVFPVNEVVHLDTKLPIDTVTTISLFGINKDVRVKGDFPVDFDIPIDHKFRINDNISFLPKEPVSVPINHTFDVPVDIVVDVNFPIDVDLDVPLKLDFETDLTIDQKLPVIIEFEIIFNPLKGIEIKQE